MKNLLLACTIMLGFHFFCPPMLKAGDHAPVAEMISLGDKDAESKTDATSVLEFVTTFLKQLHHAHLDAPKAKQLIKDERPCDALLPTAGRFPSAP